MYLNKRGLESRVLVEILLAIIVIFVMFLAFKLIQNIGDSTKQSQACKTSVVLSAQRLTIKGTEFVGSLTDLKCPTNYPEPVKNPDKIFLNLANEMYDCWNKFGEGKLQFLPTKDNTYCIICSQVSFQDEAKGRDIPGFLKYLAETKVSNNEGFPVKNFTYLDYMSGHETSVDLLDKIKAKNPDSINTNYDYGIVFLLYDNALVGKPENAAKGGIIGCLLGGSLATYAVVQSGGLAIPAAAALIGGSCAGSGALAGVTWWFLGNDHSSEWAARTVVTPYQDISKLGCTSLKGG